MKICKTIIQKNAKATETTGAKDLKRALYELCLHCVEGNLKIDHVFGVLMDLKVRILINAIINDLLYIVLIVWVSARQENTFSKMGKEPLF